MSIQETSDFRSNKNEQIAHCAEVLSHPGAKRTLTRAIYFGKKAVKTVGELSELPGLNYKRVLTEGKKLADLQVIRQVKEGGRVVGFSPVPHLKASKAQIFRLAENAKKRGDYPTKRPVRSNVTRVVVNLPKGRSTKIDAQFVTVDDIDEFSDLRAVKAAVIPPLDPPRLPELVFKYGLASILGNKGKFQDWGGEQNDLYSTHVSVKGKRYPAAFGLKGPAKSGMLTPAKMGKNADQIARLFTSPAQVFIIQYEGQISESVLSQMKKFAIANSAMEQTTVFYGVIAEEDSNRLRAAYPDSFAAAERRTRRNE